MKSRKENSNRGDNSVDKKKVKGFVEQRYSAIAQTGGSCCPTCGGDAKSIEVGRRIGYFEEELSSIPEAANMGLGCGNPVALASLKEGETVLDLGSGGGVDVFLAARRVGPRGRVTGVDMTEAMIERAALNAAKYGYKNVEFRLGEIEKLARWLVPKSGVKWL